MVEKAIESWASLEIKRSLAQLESLAELPGLLAMAVQMLDGPKTDLAGLVAQSPSICVGLIGMACRQGIDPGQYGYSILQILDRLDPQHLTHLVLSIRPYGSVEQGPPVPSRSDLVIHCLAVAHCARRLAQAIPEGPAPELAYTAGLLHDLGKLAIQQAMPKGFAQITSQAHKIGHPGHILERQYLGTDHAALGRFLAWLWQLPPELAEAIWLHHSPSAAQGQDRLLARVVTVSDYIARSCGIGNSGSFDHVDLTEQLADLVGLDLGLLQAVKGHLDRIAGQLVDGLAGHRDAWPLLAEAIRTKAVGLADSYRMKVQQGRQLEAKERQLELVGALANATSCAQTPWQLAREFLRLWQHYYQTARTCILTAPVGRPGPVYLAALGELGSWMDLTIHDLTISDMVRRSAAQAFGVHKGRLFAQTLVAYLKDRWSDDHTYWLPLACGKAPVGVLVFEMNYPVDLDRCVDQFRISAQIIATALYLMESSRSHQQQAEELAGLLSDIPKPQCPGILDLAGALAEVAAGLAHELNNPLAVISGRAQLLAESAPDEQTRRACQQIQQQAQQVSALVEGLMAYAEPTPPHKRPTPAREVLEEAIALAGQKMGTDVTNLVLDLPEDLPPLDVDSAQVASALANIIANAFQSYPNQKGPVRMAVQALQHLARISVTDQGCGMDQQTLAKAMLPFFSARPAGRQTGLGLAFADRLVSINGGRIRIASQPGQGTKVDVELPLVTRH